MIKHIIILISLLSVTNIGFFTWILLEIIKSIKRELSLEESTYHEEEDEDEEKKYILEQLSKIHYLLRSLEKGLEGEESEDEDEEKSINEKNLSKISYINFLTRNLEKRLKEYNNKNINKC